MTLGLKFWNIIRDVHRTHFMLIYGAMGQLHGFGLLMAVLSRSKQRGSHHGVECIVGH